MSLRRRLLLTLGLIVLVGFLSIARWIRGEFRNSYGQVIEETLVDYAHFIAAHAELGRMRNLGELEALVSAYRAREIHAQIFDYLKTKPTLELYVTNAEGKVVYSSRPEEIGQDFSQWKDVYRTLRGEYGARSTRMDPNDNRTSVYYVSAPIKIDGKIAGVATVYKTEGSVLVFLDRVLEKLFVGGLLSVAALALLSGLIMIWITLPLERLRAYALDVSEGKRAEPPQSNVKDIRQLGEAFEKMRVSLEGKKTIEQFTQALTHELKSPLTAIKGAAELCLEEMNAPQREQFLKNIIAEANRSHVLLEQLLKIAALEATRHLERTEAVDPVEILNEARDALMGLWKSRGIELDISGAKVTVNGDRFLLFQAVRNVLQNAIEFSPRGSKIVARVNEGVRIEIVDQGTGIPGFARPRIFEKFYSLERPDTKRKSSGLGLSFVKEVVELHHGRIEIESSDRGTCVQIDLPSIVG